MLNNEIINAVYKIHADCNHLYDGNPYSLHLRMAYNKALDYIDDINEKDRLSVLLAVLMHDTIEDCRMTYNDVINFVDNLPVCNYGFDISFNSKLVADIVYAVTNEKGKNRKERANSKYYEDIRNQKYATFIKLCDRYANLSYSLMVGNKMFNMYKKEHTSFLNQLSPISDSVEYKIVADTWKLLT